MDAGSLAEELEVEGTATVREVHDRREVEDDGHAVDGVLASVADNRPDLLDVGRHLAVRQLDHAVADHVFAGSVLDVPRETDGEDAFALLVVIEREEDVGARVGRRRNAVVDGGREAEERRAARVVVHLERPAALARAAAADIWRGRRRHDPYRRTAKVSDTGGKRRGVCRVRERAGQRLGVERDEEEARSVDVRRRRQFFEARHGVRLDFDGGHAETWRAALFESLYV